MTQDERGESFVASGSPINPILVGQYGILIACAMDLDTLSGIVEQWVSDNRLSETQKDSLERWSNQREDLLRKIGAET